MRIDVIEAKYRFETELKDILEKYTVNDNVIIYNGSKAIDLQEGYFVPQKECETIEEAVRVMDLNSQAIRIIEGKKFIVGDCYKSLCECLSCENVFSIERLENVY